MRIETGDGAYEILDTAVAHVPCELYRFTEANGDRGEACMVTGAPFAEGAWAAIPRSWRIELIS